MGWKGKEVERGKGGQRGGKGWEGDGMLGGGWEWVMD